MNKQRLRELKWFMWWIGCCNKSKNVENFQRTFVFNAYAGARFLTRALDIKERSVFEVFFSEIRHTLGRVRQQIGANKAR